MKPLNRPDSPGEDQSSVDYRVYMPDPEGWSAHLKIGWEQLYCYSKNPHEDFFHSIVHGEIYLQCGHEKLCLTCAMRQGILTTDRLNWQNKSRQRG